MASQRCSFSYNITPPSVSVAWVHSAAGVSNLGGICHTFRNACVDNTDIYETNIDILTLICLFIITAMPKVYTYCFGSKNRTNKEKKTVMDKGS